MKKNKIEVEYYDEIAKYLAELIEANLGNDNKYNVKVLIGEINSALRTLIVNGYNAGVLLNNFSKTVHRLHLDISLLVENLQTGKFELVIFEIKRTKKLGLKELSQLIGYCLVSKCHFGVLMNIDNSISGEFSLIIDSDKNLTKIIRIIDNQEIQHELGVMIWNSKTKQIIYTETGEIKTISHLIDKITKIID